MVTIKWGICYICRETMADPEIKDNFLTSIKKFFFNKSRIQEELDKNFVAEFSYWSSQDTKVTTFLCRDCSLKVVKSIEEIKKNY